MRISDWISDVCSSDLLRDVEVAIFAHPLLALFLLFEELLLAGRVAAVAFGGHILAQRGDRFARDHLAADRRRDRDIENVARDQVLQSLAPATHAAHGRTAMDDPRQRGDRLTVEAET